MKSLAEHAATPYYDYISVIIEISRTSAYGVGHQVTYMSCYDVLGPTAYLG